MFQRMNLKLRIQLHPFRSLLYLEWVLLVIAILAEALPAPFFKLQSSPLVAFTCLVVFGALGLGIPAQRLKASIYTSIEVLLILASIYLGSTKLFFFLCVVIVMRGCLRFGISGRIVVAVISFILFFLGIIYRFQQNLLPLTITSIQNAIWFIQLSFTLLFSLSILFVLLTMNALLAERKSQTELAIANDQLRQYALLIEDRATLQERNRIAREIHDSLGHSLTALNIQLETAAKLWQSNPNRAQSFLSEAKRLGSRALQDVRHSVSAMRVDPMEGRSLAVAIAALCEEFYRSTGIMPNCVLTELSLSPEITTAIYRIVQECLTNICKYAFAKENPTPLQIEVKLDAIAKEIHLVVQDNGKGFNPEQNQTGFGLQGMRERAIALGGQLQIQSHEGRGCKVTVQIPLAQ